MRLRLISPLLLAVGALLVSSNDNVAAARARRPRSPAVTQRRPVVPPPVLSVPTDTRLLVIAPHPDDEVLGAGGLMQRVYAGGGATRIVYLTDGDGYPEGVRAEDHIEIADARRLPRLRPTAPTRSARRVDGRSALGASTLHVYVPQLPRRRPVSADAHVTRSDRRGRVSLALHAASIVRRCRRCSCRRRPYRGEDLTQELAQIIGEFQPTLIVVPRKEDQHPDHCAALVLPRRRADRRPPRSSGVLDRRHQLRGALLRLAVRRRSSAAHPAAGAARRRLGLDAVPAHARGDAQQAARAAPLRDADARDGLVSRRLRALERSVLAPGIDARRPAESPQPLL